LDGNIREGAAWCLRKNCTEGQADEVKEVEEVKEQKKKSVALCCAVRGAAVAGVEYGAC
jgi:hypothetical protein